LIASDIHSPTQAPEESGTAVESSFRVPGLARDIRVKIATRRSEFEQAYELLAANYRARGYEAPGDKPFRFTPHHALPGTVTIVALDGDRVVATVTLVPDTPLLSLPMETIYGPEVARLRAAKHRLAEWISLADTDLSIREFVQVFKSLIRVGFQYHRDRGGDCWIITVNPRHSNFYQKVLGFVPMGPQRDYPTVQNHPAEAYRVTSKIMADNAPRMHDEVFGEDLPEAVLNAADWSEEHVRYFAARSSQFHEEDVDALLLCLDAAEGPCS
jgi:hypothetical protein